jgi:hypothetical protein
MFWKKEIKESKYCKYNIEKSTCPAYKTGDLPTRCEHEGRLEKMLAEGHPEGIVQSDYGLAIRHCAELLKKPQQLELKYD